VSVVFKPSFPRHWWIWLLAGALALLLLFATWTIITNHRTRPRTAEGTYISPGKDGQGRAFTASELKAAESALAGGIKIDDPQHDWFQFPPGSIQPDGRPDNPDPYPYGWTDLRSVRVGADQQYIYFKFQFWDEFPKNAVSYNGDLIRDTGAKVTDFKPLSTTIGFTSGDLGADIFFLESQDGDWVPARHITIGQGAMLSPIGTDEYMETLYQTYTSLGMVDGGPGHDFLLAAFPLSLFNLKLGASVSFSIATETGSLAFHHEAMDLLLEQPGSKFGLTIHYQLGSNTYETVLPSENTK